eukprot:SAG31_NODE_5994_length_2222_cov_1.551107_1_plen_440_part_00
MRATIAQRSAVHLTSAATQINPAAAIKILAIPGQEILLNGQLFTVFVTPSCSSILLLWAACGLIQVLLCRSEGGAVGISDMRTLKQILPNSSLNPQAVGDDEWGFHKAGTGPQGGGMWLDEGGWAPLFVNGSAKDMGSIVDIVRASQFAQAEAYRFIYQSGRRKKPHRSLLATWTYDEPWPNAAHGSIIDYYGRPKMAYYAVKQACKMIDISLSYSDVWTRPGEALRISLWLDNELPREIRSPADFTYSIEFFDITGGTVAPSIRGTRQLVLSPSSNLRVSDFAPPVISNDQPEGAVFIIRTSLLNKMDERLTVTHDYTFVVAKSRPVAPFASLLTAPATDLTIATGNGTSGYITVSSAPGATACAIFVKLTLQFKNGTDVPYAIFGRNHFWMKVRHCTPCANRRRQLYPQPRGVNDAVDLTLSLWLRVAARRGYERPS